MIFPDGERFFAVQPFRQVPGDFFIHDRAGDIMAWNDADEDDDREDVMMGTGFFGRVFSWRIFLLALALGLCSCSVGIGEYRGQTPNFDLRRFFDGKIQAWGMFQDRSGKLIKRFTVDIDGHWQGDKGTLDEHFLYQDGSRQRRIWHIEKHGDHYIGRADDVIGEAEGEAAGNALRWRYRLRLPVDDEIYEVSFDDWMFLMDDKTLMNRSRMSKFGIDLGEVTLFFRKP